MKDKKANEYWYYFGKCTPRPIQGDKGKIPKPPYKRFNSEQECWDYINAGKTFDPMTQALEQDFNKRTT